MRKTPKQVHAAINAAIQNLHTGSSSQPFSKSISIIRRWFADNCCDYWVNEDTGETTDRFTVAEQWCNDGWPVRLIEVADTIRAECGRDLAPYIY